MSKLQPSKSRTEKSGSKSQLSNIATPITHDIVPGKFTDQDWNFMLEKNDANEFITDIVEEVYSTVEKIIYDQYVERQLIPYTVSQAKDAVVELIECLNVKRDAGEAPGIHYRGWEQDYEPDVPVIDCWAQGSVPKMMIMRRPSSIIREETTELMQSLPAGTAFQPPAPEAPETIGCGGGEPDPAAYAGPFKHDTLEAEDDTGYEGPFVFKKREYDGPFIDKTPEKTPEEEQPETVAAFPAPSENETLTQYSGPFREPPCSPPCSPPPCEVLPCVSPPHFAPLSGAPAAEKMLEKLDREREACEAQKRIIPKKAPNISDSNQYINDVTGKPVQVPTVKEMPPTQVQYVAVVPPCGSWTSHASLQKINPTNLPSNRVETSFCVIAAPPVNFNGKAGPGKKSVFKKTSTSKLNGDKSASTIMPRSLIDAMEVSAGVVVREKDRVKKGPRQSNLHTEIMNQALARGLQPVRITPLQEMDINDFLDSPVVRPLASTPPIPPIPRATPLRSQ